MKTIQTTYTSLRRFNLIMGILHFIQGGFMLFVALTVDKVKEFTPPIWSNYLTFDQTQMRLVTSPEMLFDLPFAILVATFLFL